MLNISRILGLTESTLDLYGKLEGSLLKRLETGFESLADLESFRSLNKKAEDVFKLYVNCYKNRSNWQLPNDAESVVSLSRILGIYLVLSEEKFANLIKRRKEVGAYNPRLVSLELDQVENKLNEIAIAFFALEKTRVFSTRQLKNLFLAIDKFPTAIEGYRYLDQIMRNVSLEFKDYKLADKAAFRLIQIRINRLSIDHFKRQLDGLQAIKKYYSAYSKDALTLDHRDFMHVAIHPITKTLLKDAYNQRLSEKRGAKIGSGSFGRVVNFILAGQVFVQKTALDQEDELSIIKGALRVRQIYCKQHLIEIPFVSAHSMMMEKGSLPLYQMVKDYHSNFLRFPLGYVEDIIMSFFVLHGHGFTHGDVSFSNLIFVDEAKEKGLDRRAVTIKLSDFDSVDVERAPRHPGTYLLQPPEMITDKETLKRPTFAANIWSLGVILYGMLSKKWSILDVPHHLSGQAKPVFRAISSLTQQEIDRKIDELSQDSRLVQAFGSEYMEMQLMHLGKTSAHEYYISKGREKLTPLFLKKELLDKGIPDDVWDTRYRQKLLTLGLDAEFAKNKNRYELRDQFVKSGYKKYLETASKKDFTDSLEKIGKEIFSTIRDLMKGFLKIDPSERLTALDAYNLLITPMKLMQDQELNGLKSLSLEEVDHI